MTETFPTIDAFLRYLETRVIAADRARETGLKAATEMLVEEAKTLVGQEIEEWAPLAAATVREKERLGYTGRVSDTDPLLRTGEYRASLSGEAKDHSLVLGTDDPIAPFLEYGTIRMPGRPVVTFVMHHKARDALLTTAAHIIGAVAGRLGPIRSLGMGP